MKRVRSQLGETGILRLPPDHGGGGRLGSRAAFAKASWAPREPFIEVWKWGRGVVRPVMVEGGANQEAFEGSVVEKIPVPLGETVDIIEAAFGAPVDAPHGLAHLLQRNAV